VLEPEVRRLLEGTAVAHLATVLPDGSPHCVPVFVGTEGDRIATRYIRQPYSRDQERIVALIEPSVQRVGMG